MLAKYSFPKQPAIGDELTLEFHVRGDQLLGFANGTKVVDAHDNRLKDAGGWGVFAKDAWLESLEVSP